MRSETGIKFGERLKTQQGVAAGFQPFQREGGNRRFGVRRERPKSAAQSAYDQKPFVFGKALFTSLFKPLSKSSGQPLFDAFLQDFPHKRRLHEFRSFVPRWSP